MNKYITIISVIVLFIMSIVWILNANADMINKQMEYCSNVTYDLQYDMTARCEQTEPDLNPSSEHFNRTRVYSYYLENQHYEYFDSEDAAIVIHEKLNCPVYHTCRLFIEGLTFEKPYKYKQWRYKNINYSQKEEYNSTGTERTGSTCEFICMFGNITTTYENQRTILNCNHKRKHIINTTIENRFSKFRCVSGYVKNTNTGLEEYQSEWFDKKVLGK